MATIAEAQRIAQESRQRINEQRRTIEEARQRLQQTRARQLTRAELQRRTRQQIVTRKQQLAQFQQLKQTQLAQLTPFDKQVNVAEQELKKFEKEISTVRIAQGRASAIQSDIAAAQKLVDKGLSFTGETERVRKFAQQIQGTREQQRDLNQLKKDLAAVGLTPIFVKGELKGFSDELRKLDIGIEHIGEIGRKRLESLERAGIVSITLPEILPSIIKVAPSDIDQLKRIIRESTPDFKITNTQVENIIEGAIGLGFGTERFLRAKLSGDIANIRDARGQSIFTAPQASKITDIVAEVSEGYVGGWALGKLFAIGKGAYISKVPAALRTNPSWQKTMSLLKLTGGVVLTAAATDHLVRTYKERGTNAAVTEALGFLGFAAGFRKTGLKTDVQAQKEFNKIAEFFKEHKITGIKGKKGARQVAVTRVKKKVKKKDKVKEKKKEFTQEERDAMINEVERRLLEAKTPQEQMKILAELFSKMKTPKQKAEFGKMVQFFLDQGILKIEVVITGKIPEVRVKRPPTIKEKIPREPKPKKPKKKPKVEPKPTLPVVAGIFGGEQIFFNPQKIVPSQITFEPVVTPGTLPRQIQTAKQKFGLMVSQGVSQQVLQKQAFKLLTLQKEKTRLKQLSVLSVTSSLLQPQSQRLKQQLKLKQKAAQKSRQALKSLALLRTRQIQRQITRQKLGLKVPRKIRPRIRIPLPPIFKIPPLPKGVKSTPLVKTLRMKGKQGFNIVTGMKTEKQKIIGKNLPAFKALKRGRRFVDKNIQASFKLVPTGKKAKTKDIKPFNVGIKFRPSKRDPLFIVEKRKFRLDSPFEVGQIKKARAAKPKRRKKK